MSEDDIDRTNAILAQSAELGIAAVPGGMGTGKPPCTHPPMNGTCSAGVTHMYGGAGSPSERVISEGTFSGYTHEDGVRRAAEMIKKGLAWRDPATKRWILQGVRQQDEEYLEFPNGQRYRMFGAGGGPGGQIHDELDAELGLRDGSIKPGAELRPESRGRPDLKHSPGCEGGSPAGSAPAVR